MVHIVCVVRPERVLVHSSFAAVAMPEQELVASEGQKAVATFA